MYIYIQYINIYTCCIHIYIYIYIHVVYIYIYLHPTYRPHVSRCFGGGHWKWNKNNTQWRFNDQFYIYGRVPENLTFWYGPHLKSSLKGMVTLCMYIYIYIYIYNYLHIYHYMFINCFQVFKTDVKCMLSRFNINISIQKTKRGAFVAFSQYRQQLWR